MTLTWHGGEKECKHVPCTHCARQVHCCVACALNALDAVLPALKKHHAVILNTQYHALEGQRSQNVAHQIIDSQNLGPTGAFEAL